MIGDEALLEVDKYNFVALTVNVFKIYALQVIWGMLNVNENILISCTSGTSQVKDRYEIETKQDI